MVLLADKAWYLKKRASQLYGFTIYGTKERIWRDEFTDQLLSKEKHDFITKVMGSILFHSLQLYTYLQWEIKIKCRERPLRQLQLVF
jgi:hypothetical protein